MRALLLIISTTLLSFSVSEKDEPVFGMWKGAYGMGNKVKQTWVYLGPNNSLDFYDGSIKPENKMSGFYTLIGDSSIVFVCAKNNTHKEIRMKGNLNRTKSFVDGIWESDDDRYGSFYLQKQKGK